jgi:hypothetical protein
MSAQWPSNLAIDVDGHGGLNGVLVADWLSGSIPPGSSKAVTVQFTPIAAQTYTGLITVVSDATSGTSTIAASGIGTIPTGGGGVSGYYVWGGQDYEEYLGFFTCTFCTEYHSDSINNLYGRYGSEFSPTSIRNAFSKYGSDYSSTSSCNPYASHPPRVYNADRSVYYGELTRNLYRVDAIKTTAIVTWLETNVCKR